MRAHRRSPVLLVGLGLLASAGPSFTALEARREPYTPLSIEWLARDPATTVGTSPFNVFWSPDSATIHYFRADATGAPASLWAVDPRTGETRLLTEEERRAVPLDTARSPDGARLAFTREGALWISTGDGSPPRRVLATLAGVSSPAWLADGRRVAVESGGNLFLYDTVDGALEQVTDVRPGTPPRAAAPEKTPAASALAAGELALFPALRARRSPRSAQVTTERRLAPIWLGGTGRRAALRMSPSGRHVAVLVTDEEATTREPRSLLPLYVTESGFVESQELGGFLKAGAPEPSSRLAVHELGQGALTWLEADVGGREVTHHAHAWSPDGTRLLWLASATDLKDRWLLVWDAATGTSRIVDHEHDEAWVRDTRGDVATSPLGWVDDRTIYFASERSGWNHIYTLSVDTGELRALTAGPWEVDTFRLGRQRRHFYLTASKAHPAERHVYRVSAQGGPLEQLTATPGWHTPIVSPDERWIALLSGDERAPADLFVQEARPGAIARRLVSLPAPDFARVRLRPIEFVSFPDRRGHRLWAQLIVPDGGTRGRPAIIHVHGTGYAQAVRRQWSSEYLIFNFLAQHGYVVLNLDYLGSSGYGRDSRVALYRGLGQRDVESAVAAVDYLVTRHGVDRRRVGIYGGSYGGFYTLMALFNHPGIFAAGVALYPCTDWAHHPPRFVRRYLGSPLDDPEPFREASPIHRAEGLRDPLLILHGIEDRTVPVQDTIRLAQRLIDLGKTTWGYHLYPLEGHGWRLESTRADYLRRLAAFFDTHLRPGR